MDLLQLIGIASIVFLIFNYIIKPKQQRKMLADEMFEEKLSILSQRHYLIKEIFNVFEKNQSKIQSKDDDIYSFYTAKVFERYISVKNSSEIENLRNEVIAKVKELEATEKGRNEIQKCIEDNRNFLSERYKEKKIKELQNQQLFYKYNDLLKRIFKDKYDVLDESIIISQLSIELKIPPIEASKVFSELAHIGTGILSHELDNFKKDGQYKKYSYDENRALIVY